MCDFEPMLLAVAVAVGVLVTCAVGYLVSKNRYRQGRLHQREVDAKLCEDGNLATNQCCADEIRQASIQ